MFKYSKNDLKLLCESMGRSLKYVNQTVPHCRNHILVIKKDQSRIIIQSDQVMPPTERVQNPYIGTWIK